MTTTPAKAKSGVKNFKAGEILFNDGEIADSLFIIQKGQVRLYKPKGKGFIELAVLRAGEVIGEMAYFDEDVSGGKRSCSASAITGVEIIEISFLAFGKTMQSLNPWFKTIITTLAARLRKTNTRIRELEDNQVSVSYGGKHPGYEFMKSIEVMRILGTIFLVFRAHGDLQNHAFSLNRKTLTLYTQEMYQIMEAKLESILGLLVQLGWMEISDDENSLPNILMLKNIEIVRQIFIFYNSERTITQEKKLKVGEKCEMLIAQILDTVSSNPLIDIPHLKVVDNIAPRFTKHFNITSILNEFKAKNIIIHTDHLDDGKNIGLFGEVLTKDSDVMVEIDFAKVQKLYPIIRFMNAIKKINIEKAPAGSF